MPDDLGENYNVGFCKPPKHTRYRPGQSGNPAGSSGSNAAAKAMARVTRRKVTITENGRTRRVSPHDVIVIQLSKKALNGDLRSAKQLFELALTQDTIEPRKGDAHEREDEARKSFIEELCKRVHPNILVKLAAALEEHGNATRSLRK